jgi:hypothetical protein
MEGVPQMGPTMELNTTATDAATTQVEDDIFLLVGADRGYVTVTFRNELDWSRLLEAAYTFDRLLEFSTTNSEVYALIDLTGIPPTAQIGYLEYVMSELHTA